MSRIDSLVGSVISVDDVLAGSVLRDDHPAGALVLRLTDAADFAEAGGSVEVDGTVYTYSAADLALDELTLTSPLIAAAELDTAVTVVPRSPSRVATVSVDGADDPLRVVVPQALVDQVPTGLREPGEAESVSVGPVYGVWQLLDVHAADDRTVKEGSFRQGVAGVTYGGLQEDGSADFTEARATRFVQDGTPLDDLLGPRVHSLGDFRMPAGVQYGPSTVDMALIEVTVDVPPGHRLYLDVRGWMRGQNPGTVGLLRCTYTHATTGMPPRPTGGSTEILPHCPVTYETSWTPVRWLWTVGTTSGGTIRALIWIYRDAGNDPMARDFVVDASLAQVHGASGFAGIVRATPGGSGDTTPPPALVERTQRYDLGPHSLWIGSSHIISGYRLGDVQAGRSASGYLWDTAILLPAAARSLIAGSEEVVSARVRLAQSVYPTTIRPHIGTIQTTNITGTRAELAPRNINPGSRTYTPAAPSGWTDLDAHTLTALKAGDPGLWIPNLGSGQSVGRFHGPDAAGALRPQIEITVRSRT